MATKRLDALNKQIEESKAKTAKLQKQAASIRAKLQVQDRKIETRRKILAGAAVLHRCKTSEEANTKLLALLDEFLTKTADRELFDLPPKVDAENTLPESEAGEH